MRGKFFTTKRTKRTKARPLLGVHARQVFYHEAHEAHEGQTAADCASCLTRTTAQPTY